jgi:hypothetical protein
VLWTFTTRLTFTEEKRGSLSYQQFADPAMRKNTVGRDLLAALSVANERANRQHAVRVAEEKATYRTDKEKT